MRQPRRTRKRVISRISMLALALLLPATVAGCPEFRNQVVDATETAVIGIVLGDQEPCDAFETAGLDIVGATFDLFFDQFRSGTTGY